MRVFIEVSNALNFLNNYDYFTYYGIKFGNYVYYFDTMAALHFTQCCTKKDIFYARKERIKVNSFGNNTEHRKSACEFACS